MLPPRRPKASSGIKRAADRVWPRHRKFVRSHACCAPNCAGAPIEFAHVRTAANSGTGVKPADWFGVSLCSECHRDQHSIGQKAFEKKHGINLLALASEFANKSPDMAMKEELKGRPAEE